MTRDHLGLATTLWALALVGLVGGCCSARHHRPAANPASVAVGASANSATAQCGDEITYTPSAAKRAFRLVVAGHCPVKFTVHCNGGQDPTPGTTRPGASALVDCDPGKAVKTVTLACQSNNNQDCAFSYEVTDSE